MAETITIVLNTTAQTAGIQATVTGLQRLKGTVDNVGMRLASFGRQLVAGLVPTITLVGLARMAQASLENADAMGKAGQRAGETVYEFSRLAEVAKLADVSIQDLTKASKELPRWLEETGQQGKSLLQVIFETADRFAAMPDSLAKSRLAVDLFGESGQKLIPLLNQGSDAIRQQMEEAEQFGLVIGPKFAREAEKFNDNLSRILSLFRGIANMTIAAVIPAINELSEKFIKWVKDTDTHLPVIDYLILQFKQLGILATIAAAGVDLIRIQYQALGQLWKGDFKDSWKTALEEVGGTFERFKERFDKIANMRRRPDRGQGASGGAESDPELAIARQKAALEKNALEILVAQQSESMSKVERERMVLGLTRERLELLDRLHKMHPEGSTDQNATFREFLGVLQEIDALEPDGFFERFSDGIQALTEEFDNLASSVADTLLDGVANAIDTVADGMWNVIDGTATWGELFQNVARNIISDLVRVGLQEIALDALKRGITTAWSAFKKMFVAQDVATSNAGELAKTPALAGNALLASIGSWGLAVAIGVGALAAIMASVGAFAEGGVVAGGEQLIRVNERGRESVLNAQATALLGDDLINSLNRGDFSAFQAQNDMMLASMAGGGGVSSGGESRQSKLNVAIFDDRTKIRQFFESNEGQGMILDTFRNNRHEFDI